MVNEINLFEDKIKDINFRPCLQCEQNFICSRNKKFCSKDCSEKYYSIQSNTDKYKQHRKVIRQRSETRIRDRKQYEAFKKLHPDN